MQVPSVELLRSLRIAVSCVPASSATFARRQTCSHILRNRTRTPCIHNRCRPLTTSAANLNEPRPVNTRNPYAPTHHDRGPKSTEDTQTDFGAMDVLGHIPAPATSVDACTSDGFHLDNGVKTTGGAGIVLVGGEAFTWEPWRSISSPSGSSSRDSPEAKVHDLLDPRRGTLTLPRESLGLLEMLHPKPDLMIIGTGGKLWMLSQDTRRYISEILGCRLDVMDTANAAAAYNLLAKERGIEGGSGVGGLFLPIGWVGPKVAAKRR